MIRVHGRACALRRMIYVVALSVALAAFASLTYAQQPGQGSGSSGAVGHHGPGGEYFATITFVSGAVGVWHEGASEWTMVQAPYNLSMGDHVRTGADARAVIVFADASELLMHEQTTVQITPREPAADPRGVSARVKVFFGEIFNRITPGQSDLEFETPDAVAAVRGTEFIVRVGGNFSAAGASSLTPLLSHDTGPELTFEQLAALFDSIGLNLETVVLVLTGQVDVFNALGGVQVTEGQRTQVRDGDSPADPINVSEEEMEQALGWVKELDEERETAASASDDVDEDDEGDVSDDEASDRGQPIIPGTVVPPVVVTGVPVSGWLTSGSATPAVARPVLLAAYDEADDNYGLVFASYTDHQGYYVFADVPAGDYHLLTTNIQLPMSGLPPPSGDLRVGEALNVMVPVTVIDEPVDLGTIDLAAGFALDFTLEWRATQKKVGGGSGVGSDTFFLSEEYPVTADYPVHIEWELHVASSDYLSDANVVRFEVYPAHDLSEPLSDWPVQGNNKVSIEHLEPWPSPLRLLLTFEFPSGEVMWVMGPKLEHRGSPLLTGIRPAHVVHGRGSSLEITLLGQNLQTINEVHYSWMDQSFGRWDVVSVAPDGNEATVIVDWEDEGLVEQLGLVSVQLVDPYVEDIVPNDGDIRMLITSTDLSGNGPGVVPQRGDLHRSGTGSGPGLDLDAPGQLGGLDVMEYWNLSGSDGLLFVGDYLIATTLPGDEIASAPLSGGISTGMQPFTSGVPFTVADVADATDPLVYYRFGGGIVFTGATFQDDWTTVAPISEDYDDLLVHDGVLVVLVQDQLHTYDARQGGTPFATIALPDFQYNEQYDYRLAISTPVWSQTPLVHVVEMWPSEWGPSYSSTGNVVWTFELYTLEDLWYEHFDADISQFAVSPDGSTLYIATQVGDLGNQLHVVALETTTGTQIWNVDIGEHLSLDPWGHFLNNGMAVHPSGRVYVLVAGEDRGWVLEIAGGTVQRIFESPTYPDQPLYDTLFHGGIGIAASAPTDSGYLYGFATANTSITFFGIDLERESPETAVLDLTDLVADFFPLTLSIHRDAVWLGAHNLILRISEEPMASIPGDPPLIKRADKANAQIGDVITYTITFDNTRLVDDETQLVDHTNVWIQDVLPPGFVFVEGSSFVYPSGTGAGSPVALAPDSHAGRTLQFELTDPAAGGTIPENTRRTLTYQAIVGPRVVEGATYSNTAIGYYDGPNTIRGVLEASNLCAAAEPEDPVQDLPGGASPPAPAGLPQDCDVILTNVARADVRIVPSVFTMSGLVVGKVFYDYDGDGMQSPGEPGIPGARIVMETGVSVATDPFGKFSLSNLTPSLHVFMLDESSLPVQSPDGSVVTGVFGGPHRLIDLAGGGMFTVNFAVQAELSETDPAEAE